MRDPAAGEAPDQRVKLVKGDATNADDIARVASGADAVVSAISPRPNARGLPAPSLSANSRALIKGLRDANVKRVLYVGGASSLEVAPGKATRDMYIGKDGKLDEEASVIGYQSVAVPGTVAGLALALKTYGSMKLADVIAPAIRLAETGFPISKRLAQEFEDHRPALQRFAVSRRLACGLACWQYYSGLPPRHVHPGRWPWAG